jgi:hypothetical protein
MSPTNLLTNHPFKPIVPRPFFISISYYVWVGGRRRYWSSSLWLLQGMKRPSLLQKTTAPLAMTPFLKI